MTRMKYNNGYRKLTDKSVDTQALQWRRDYLNGLSAQQWCEYAAQLNEDGPNPKVIRNFNNQNNNDYSFPRKLFLK